MKIISTVSVLLFAATAAAQSIATFPSTHANILNGTSYAGQFPYSNGVSRMQSEYDSWDITIPNGRQITSIGFRQDGANVSTGHSLQLEVRMGTTLSTAANIGGTFDSNFATGPVTVFGPALFAVPNLSSTTPNTVIWCPLTTPYTYNSSQNLLIEWRIQANNNGNAAWTYYLDAANYVSTVTTGVQFSCPHSGNQTARIYSASQGAQIGGYWYLNVDRAPASSLAFWMGAVNSPLVPPYSLQTAVPGIGAGCMGQLNLSSPIYVMTFSTNTGGAFNWSIPVPNNRLRWNNATIESQAAILDFFAPGGIVVTTADQIQFGIDPANTVITSTGSSTGTTGSVYRNYGIVTLLQYN